MMNVQGAGGDSHRGNLPGIGGAAGLSRRNLLKYSAMGGAGIAFSGLLSACGDDASSSSSAIKLPLILDATGALNVYCLPQIDAIKYAIEDINSKGGLLGRKVELDFRDGQSAQDTYVQFANEVLPREDTSVIIGAVSSASREAMRPVVDRYKKPYIYPALYEGGVCDTYTFIRGLTPSQQTKDTLIPWAAENVGKKMYIVAADYIAGNVLARWAEIYGEDNGIETVGKDLVPLDVTAFQSINTKIQGSGADFVFSVLVGANHLNFYRQFAAAGLSSDIKIVSPLFGLGNEHIVLAPEESQGIVTALDYFQELDTPVNAKFVADWQKRFGDKYPYVTDYAVLAWDSVQVWAEAVRLAESIEPEKVLKALESGIEYESPCGPIKLDPQTHHFELPVHIGIANDKHGFDIVKSFDNVKPSYELEKCDLIANPDTQEQFIPTGS